MNVERIAAGLVIGVLLSATALAQSAATNAQREVNQERRIQNGINDGSLNSREAARLERGQAHIDRMQNRAASDGVVTKGEAARINQQQNQENRRIHRQRHDAQTR